jgi:hypothetical protein
MDTRAAVILGASLVFASFVLGYSLAPKPAEPQAPQVGRFRMSGVPGHAYVIDTATGQVWEDFATPTQGTSDQEFKRPKVK